MNSGNAFGRRSSPAASKSNSRSDSHSMPVTTTEEPDTGDALQKAIVWMVGGAGLLVFGAIAVLIVALARPSSGAAPVGAVGQPTTSASLGDTVAESVPSELPNSGPAERPSPTQTAAPARAGAASVSEQQRTAALKFFGFYHLNTRVRSAYCAKLGVDLAGFTEKFSQSQSRSYARASAIAKAAGSTEEQIYAGSRAELDGLIGADMEKIGRQVGMGPNGACQIMVQMADAIVPGIDFAKVMPDEHRTLMGS